MASLDPACCYFAFGSNMNPERVRSRGLHVVDLCGARLPDYRLVFDKSSSAHPGIGHANIRHAPGEAVEGVLYELSDATQIEAMDGFESAPINYSRHIVQVWPTRAGAGVQAAWTYVANAAVLAEGLRPDSGYLHHLLAGEPWLSGAYCERLRAWPLADPP